MNVWESVSGTGQYLILKAFTSSLVWNGMYSHYYDTPAMREPIQIPPEVPQMIKKGNRIRSKVDHMKVGSVTRTRISGVTSGIVIDWSEGVKRAYYGLTGLSQFEIL